MQTTPIIVISMLIVTIPWGPLIARVTLDTKETEQHVLVNMITEEPRFNEPSFNVVLDITNDILCPRQSYSKMYGIEPRYNEPLYNELQCQHATEDKC